MILIIITLTNLKNCHQLNKLIILNNLNKLNHFCLQGGKFGS